MVNLNDSKSHNIHYILGFVAGIAAMIIFNALTPSSKAQDEVLNVSSVSQQVDINKFTNEYNQVPKEILMTPAEMGSIKFLMKSMQVFTKEKGFEKFPVLTTYLENHDTKVQINDSYRFDRYTAQLSDGSNIYSLFHHDSFAPEVYEMNIYGLTPDQCKYLVREYKTDPNVVTEVQILQGHPNMDVGISSQTTTCDSKSKSTALNLKYSLLSNTKHYSAIEDNVKTALSNIAMNSLKVETKANVFYSQSIPNNEMFLSGVDYLVNPTTGRVYIGALSFKDCKDILYHLDNSIKANIPSEGCDRNRLNVIELFAS